MNPQPQAPNPMITFLPMMLVFCIFYFLLIRPQKREQMAHKRRLETLQKNDEIVTTGGIHGTIVNVKEKTFVLRVDDNAKLEIEKSAVGQIKKTQG